MNRFFSYNTVKYSKKRRAKCLLRLYPISVIIWVFILWSKEQASYSVFMNFCQSWAKPTRLIFALSTGYGSAWSRTWRAGLSSICCYKHKVPGLTLKFSIKSKGWLVCRPLQASGMLSYGLLKTFCLWMLVAWVGGWMLGCPRNEFKCASHGTSLCFPWGLVTTFWTRYYQMAHVKRLVTGSCDEEIIFSRDVKHDRGWHERTVLCVSVMVK